MKAGVVTATLAALVASTGVHASLHPSFPMQYCTKAGCTTKNTSIVMDGKEITLTDESQYPAHGIDIQGNVMKLTLKNGAGPRVYLAASDTKYEMIKMVGKELTYDVDTSQLDCTMNGALYFVQMPESGADKGSGYCDANGVGGTNCEEMDIWEANQYATAMTVHPTSHDSSGCGLNPYRRGHKDMYGPGANFSVDTSKPFSVVTQFLADSSGAVNEMRRMYLQNGNVIQGDTLKQDKCNVAGMAKVMQGGSVLAMSIWASSGMSWLDGGDAGPCPIGTTSKDAVVTFSNIRVGDIGTTAKGTDQTPPPPPSLPPAPLWGQCGGLEWEGTTECAEGTCIKMNDWTWKCQPGGNTPTTTKPTPTPSTTNPGPTPTSTTTKPTPTSSSPSGTVAQWGQCGGINYSGPTTCASGFKCVHLNDWYYQCQ